ncbi:HAD family hydrolase [Candidatus Pacearchaeota archaeon]|nr:HAD family hydrolase [Candidatus Pacearchaeota archaeon]|tara:strand:- start:800 stop:1444 length:645 start_codon:yes stop_codon:yes gene_type:complete
MIKAVLFDLDGVLVDAVKLHQQAFIDAIAPYKHITEEEHMRDLNALPTKDKLEKLKIPEEFREKIYEDKQEKTWKLISQLIRPIPEVLETISEIKKKGLKFAVCSNSIRKSTGLFLEHAGVSGFQFYFSNQDVENAKPDPEMYIKAMEKLGISKDEVLIVEDAPRGLQAAYDSGANVCKVNNPYELKKVLSVLKTYNGSEEVKQDTYLQEQKEP